jgi:hypothetical protein
MARERRRVRAVAVLASMVALSAIGCADGGDQAPVSSPPSPPDRSTSGRARNVTTVAEAIAALEDTVQDAYVTSGITRRAGFMLVEQARLCIGAHEEGDFVQAFSYIEGAHAMIQAGLARGVVSSEEIAVRLHRSFDLIGAMVATNPVEAP